MYRRLNIAICEDEANDARLLHDMIKHSGLLCDIVFFDCAERFLDESDISKFDLFLLDIYLGGISGVELAREIRKQNDDCEIVFTTASDAHALECFKVNALQYLVKPLDLQKVTKMIERFMRIRDRHDLNYCTVVVAGPRSKFSTVIFITLRRLINTVKFIRKTVLLKPIPHWWGYRRGCHSLRFCAAIEVM